MATAFRYPRWPVESTQPARTPKKVIPDTAVTISYHKHSKKTTVLSYFFLNSEFFTFLSFISQKSRQFDQKSPLRQAFSVDFGP